LTHLLENLRAAWLIGASVCTLAYYLSMFGLWFLLLRVLGSAAAAVSVYRAFVLSLLPNYVPGKGLAWGTRAGLLPRAGPPLPIVTASIIWDMILALASVAPVSLAFVFYPVPLPWREYLWTLLAGLGLMLLFVAIALRLPQRWNRWTGVSQAVRQSPA